MNISANEALKRGLQAYNEGKLDNAERIFRAIINAQPEKLATANQKNVLAEAHNNLGSILITISDLDGSSYNFQKAIEIKQDFAEAYCNLGYLSRLKYKMLSDQEKLKKLTDIKNYVSKDHKRRKVEIKGSAHAELSKAIDYFTTALKFKANLVEALNNLGEALAEKGNIEESVSYYEKALKYLPTHDEAKVNLAATLKQLGRYREAVKYYDSLAKTDSKSQALQCLFANGDYDEVYDRLKQLSNNKNIDIEVAAMSAFFSNQLKKEDPYPFCKRPLDFLEIGNLKNDLGNYKEFINSLLRDGAMREKVWEPQNKTTKKGFQTTGNLFETSKNFKSLEKIILQNVERYYNKFKADNCDLIKLWPKEYQLEGWFVRLIKGGHMNAHIHPTGWLSGVVYLQTIKSNKALEGSIEFSLHGNEMPVIDENYPRKLYQPCEGDILMFPASLFHRTIPFNEDTERIVIGFDVQPCMLPSP